MMADQLENHQSVWLQERDCHSDGLWKNTYQDVATKPLREGYRDGVDTIAQPQEGAPGAPDRTARDARTAHCSSALELTGRHGFSRSAYNKRYAPHAPQRGKAEYGFLER
jgi:hypothetical protein